MSGKAGPSEPSVDVVRGHSLLEGPATVLSWITVFPVRGAQHFDRTTGARAMAFLPFAGLIIGCIPASLAATLLYFGVPPLLVSVVVVASYQVLSRMMHLDGLADVGDALGSYAPPERAREILADRYTGALGMGAVLLTTLAAVAGFAAIFGAASWEASALAVVAVPSIARLSGMVGCHRRFSPFSNTGFGSLIIGTISTTWIAAWALGLLLASIAVGTLLSAPLGISLCVSISACLLLAYLLGRHFTRRFGGLNGDCIGAMIETTTAVAAVVSGIATSVY